MKVDDFFGFAVGDWVFPLLGPKQGCLMWVVSIEINKGAANGWFTCATDSESFLYAGEELRHAKKEELPPMTRKDGTKYDQGKHQMGLISSRFLNGLASVLTFGAKKYQAHNWRKGIQCSRLYDALQRHLTAWNDGEDLDPESGLPHLYHAACCLMFLAETVEVRPDLDDRWSYAKNGNKVPDEKSHPVPENA